MGGYGLVRRYICLIVSPTAGIIAYFIGFLLSAIIRAPFATKSKTVATVRSQRDGLEIVLLVLMALGTAIIPIVYAFTSLFIFADRSLSPLEFGAGIVFMLGYLLLLYRSHADLATNWSVTLEIKDNHALVTSGVYKYMRHPMYTSIYFLAIAQWCLLPNWVAGSACFIAFTLMIIFRLGREERMMAEVFGTQYEEYAQRTKRLIPKVY